MTTPPPATGRPREFPDSIRARGLTRIYEIGAAQVAGINGINLTVPAGQLVVLKGESGSGKSTLLPWNFASPATVIFSKPLIRKPT